MFIRKPLRSDVGDEVLKRIARGDLPADCRINESTLSIDLGISRTPLRESLITLQEKGILDSAMGRGFIVKKIDADEAQETLVVLATLEPLALRLAGIPPTRELISLGNVTSRIRLNPADIEQTVKLLLHWTALLLRSCSNSCLLMVISNLHQLLYRYDHLIISSGNDIQPVLASQTEIMELLRAGDLVGAATALGQLRMDQGSEYKLRLQSQNEGKGHGQQASAT